MAYGVIQALDLDQRAPTITFAPGPAIGIGHHFKDGPSETYHGGTPLRISLDMDGEEGPEAQIASYRRALRVGDRVEWLIHPTRTGEIGTVVHPRPTVDAITAACCARLGIGLDVLSDYAAQHATVWYAEGVNSFETSGCTFDCLAGEVRFGHLADVDRGIELRGPYIIVDADELPATVIAGMVGGAVDGLTLGSVIGGIEGLCGLTGEERIERVEGTSASLVVRLVAGDPIALPPRAARALSRSR